VMTTPVIAVDEHTPLEEALSRMVSAATRRLIVTGEGQTLAGILSLDDVLDHLSESVRSVGRLIEKQQPHVHA
jgi:signal-transduction protein with cAMP-binding, CBS, and nucleotidyltransferase domain